MIASLWRTLARLRQALLPGQCGVCHGWPAQPVCAECRQAFASVCRRCPRCALPLDEASGTCPGCNERPPRLDHCIAAVDYAYPWNDLILRYKFQGSPGDAPWLAEMMREAPGARQLLGRADWVVPVPLSSRRLAQRGFNQAWELARVLAPARVRHDLLGRRRDTQAQSRLNREDRLLNLQRALAVPQARVTAVAGRHVLLVDDVMTTGATLDAASLALRAAGARRVSALVFARAAKSGHAEHRPRPP